MWAERMQIDGRKEWEDDGSIKRALNIQKSDRILLLKGFFEPIHPVIQPSASFGSLP